MSRDAAWQKYRHDVLARFAEDTGIEVTILTCQPVSPFVGPPRRGVRRIAFRSWLPLTWRVSFFPGAIVEIVRRPPDAVLAVNNMGHLTEYCLFLLCKALRTRFIWWTHGFDHAPRNRAPGLATLRRMVMRAALRHADGVIVFSEQGRRSLLRAGVRRDRLVRADNTLDTAALTALAGEFSRCDRARWCDEFGLDPSRRYLIFVGRLTRSKRVMDVVRVLERVAEHRPEVGLLVVGDGPEQERLHRYVASRGIAGVHLLGAVYDDVQLAKLFATAEVAITPANVGLTIVQAFCFGLPFVTAESDSHGPEIQYLVDGQNGFLAGRTDPIAEMARRIAALLEDRDLWEAMSGAAADTVRGPANVARMVASMYRGVVGLPQP